MSELRIALRMLLVMTVLTGVVYPAAVTAFAQIAFHRVANGSIIERNGAAVGSELLGQSFSAPGYFWSRPSATMPAAYDGAASSGSNQAPTNPAFIDSVRQRIAALRAADPDNPRRIPVDLVTASGSGLDPHISPAAADYQVSRVARARGWSEAQVRALVAALTEGRSLGILGEPRVNVLELNLALDARGARM